MSDDNGIPTRRRVLASVGATVAAGALAGCGGDGNGNGGNGGSGNGDGNGNDPGADDGVGSGDGNGDSGNGDADQGDGTNGDAETTTADPFETEVEETVGSDNTYELAVDAGDVIRLTVEPTSADDVLVYVSDRSGNVHLNEGTDSTETWEIEVAETADYAFEILPNGGEAAVTIERAAGTGTGGDGSAGNEDDSTGNGSGVQCAELTEGGYSRYDEPDSPFVGTFEHPGDVAATGTVNNDHSLTIRIYIGDMQPFDVFPTQRLVGTESPTDAQRGEAEGLEQVGEIDFGGETVPLIRAEAGSNGDDQVQRYTNYPYYIAGLPHEGSEGTRYYRFDVRATVQFADDLKPTVCVDTYEEIARRMLQSLEPNPDTTVEDAGV